MHQWISTVVEKILHGSKARGVAPSQHRTRLRLEALEQRDLMSANNPLVGMVPAASTSSTTLHQAATSAQQVVQFDPIQVKYKSLGGAGGILGQAVSPEMPTPYANGTYQKFQKGTIFWSASTGAHDIYGPSATEYYATSNEVSANGTVVAKVLGLPTADELPVAGVPGAQVTHFQGGDIYWSSATAAHVVSGAIGARYSSLNGPNGFLGLPTSDEQLMTGGRVSSFQNGKITWTPQQGAVAVATLAQLGPLNTGNIWIGVPGGHVHGWSQLTLYKNGSFNFVGDLKDSGTFSYVDSLMFGIKGASGTLYTFTHKGNVGGWDSSSHEDSWNVSGTNPALAADWTDVVQGVKAGNWSWSAGVNLDGGKLLNDIETALHIIPAVAAVVALF